MFTLFPAKSVITMNPSQPFAQAVLVNDEGRIVEVGSEASMQPWLSHHPHRVDDRFKDAYLCPGFIDLHLHPTMAAVLLPMNFVTAMRWKLPWGTVEHTTTEADFTARLKALNQEQDNDEPLFVWGYHHLWHGSMSRQRINAVSEARPIIVWHRSFHELYMNDGALQMLNLDESKIRPGAQIDFANGHFYENGLVSPSTPSIHGSWHQKNTKPDWPA